MDNSLRKTLIATLVIIALSTLWFVASYSRAAEPTSYRSFQVTGVGDVTTIPDIAQFSFGVLTQGDTNLTQTQEKNTERTNSTIVFLKEQGIVEKDITTKSYSVTPRYQYYSCSIESTICPPAEVVGYTIQQQVEVKVRDFTILGGLLTGVIEKGANIVSQLVFTIDDPTQIQNEAREKAVKEAQRKAQTLADAGGFRVGRLLSIQESVPSPFYDFVSLEAQSRSAPSPSIEPGSQEIQVSIVLTYEIK